MRGLRALAIGFFVLLLSACLGNQSKAVKLQDSAQNFNQAMRFGRMDIAQEHVAPRVMADFATRHRAWGRELRLIDLEFQGIEPRGDDARVFVAVGWQRYDEQELRVTQLVQTWRYGQRGWKLIEEERAGGDVGLLGEQVEVVRPERRGEAHFRSVTIR